ncbi:hypothetical protein RUND412_007935 [Rhizina undulata]
MSAHRLATILPPLRHGGACHFLSPRAPLRMSYQSLVRHQSSVSTSGNNREPAQLICTLNAPRSTLPAELEFPKESGNKLSYLIQVGKSYVAFFKTGIKNVFYNFKATRPIQERIDAAGSITDLVAAQKITRAEFQLVMRSRHDTRRIPLFALIILICGEFSPLILPFISNVVPFNCRIPRQQERDRRLLEARRKSSFTTLPPPIGEKGSLEQLTRPELLHISRVLGIHSPKWPEAILPPTVWLRFRLDRRIQYLNLDDILLSRFGGPGKLDAGEEVLMAATDRGISTLDKSDAQLREELKRWLEKREKSGELTPQFWLL